jgi:hypothetical protein
MAENPARTPRWPTRERKAGMRIGSHAIAAQMSGADKIRQDLRKKIMPRTATNNLDLVTSDHSNRLYL